MQKLPSKPPLMKKKTKHASPVKSTLSRTPRNKFESKSKSPRKTKRSLWYDDCSNVTPLTPDDKCEEAKDSQEMNAFSSLYQVWNAALMAKLGKHFFL